MRKLTFLWACLFLIGVGLVNAQSKSVSGKVLSAEDGQPVIGASVMVKGTSTGTITDVNGGFTITLPSGPSILWFSYVGMKTLELPAANNMVVRLESDSKVIDEIVVTAMGMKRERKALGYAVQDVKAEDLTRAGSNSLSSALQGKLAGVEIKPSSGMPGASTQITIRGARSFTGNNSPLYIIDGMPVASTADYSTGNGVTGTDNATRSVDIDPNDIESINVLKGQAAAALYGIRASNGVIVITTKSGKGAKSTKPIISFNSSASGDRVSRLPEIQTRWAQGTPNSAWTTTSAATVPKYLFNPNGSTNWGPQIVDLPKDPTYGGNVANTNNGNDITKYADKYYVPQRKIGGLDPWVTPASYDNISTFFETGLTLNNSLNISQATDKSNYSVGFGNTSQTGIVPGTSMNRINAKALAETKLSNTWKTGFSANYTQTYIEKAPGANDGLVATVYAAPSNYDLKGIPFASPTDPYLQILYRATNFNNPYWAIANNKFNEKTNRFFGNAYLEFAPIKSLLFKYQVGADSYTTHNEDIHEYKSKNTLGSVINKGVTTTVYNSLLTANYDVTLMDEIKINVVAGNEINHEVYKSYWEQGQNFNFGGWPHINNSTVKDASEAKSQNRTVGFFGNLMASYKDMLYLNASLRSDIVSSMPRGNRQFTYPSVSLGFILTELDILKNNNILSFAKVRASYAEVGQAGSYTPNYYSTPSYSGGFWTAAPIVYPLNSVVSYTPNNVMYDPNLKPQNTQGFELGTDLKFLDNMFGIEYTYSRQNVTDQIFSVPLAGSTGASSLVMNGGAIHTNTHELLVSINAIRTKKVDWTVNVNFTKMDNYVDELAPGVESIFLGGFVTPQVRAGIGEKFPVIYGSQYKRDAQGRVLVNETPTSPYYGMPMIGSPGVIGKVAPEFIMGASTTLRVADFTLSATFDWKNGGQMYHGTNGLLTYTYGLAKSTEDRETPFIYPGFKADGTANNIQRGGANDPAAYYNLNANTLGSIDEAFVFDNSFIKMRELSLSYKLPKIKSFNITVSAFARNFLLWTNLPNFDPEASQGNTNMGGAFERFTTPQSSSVGMGLNVVF